MYVIKPGDWGERELSRSRSFPEVCWDDDHSKRMVAMIAGMADRFVLMGVERWQVWHVCMCGVFLELGVLEPLMAGPRPMLEYDG